MAWENLPPLAPVRYDTVYMRGGWDLSTPTLELYAGVLRDVQNFEVSAVTAGGYTRIAGYERFDGHASPSDAIFLLVQVVTYTNIPVVGTTLTGFTSGATGVIIAVTANYMILTAITGTFTNSEVVKVGATVIATLVPQSTQLSPLVQAQYTALAADYYRTLIAAVPGSGPVRGVVAMIVGSVDSVFAFRNNAGGTGCDVYKSSGSGWTIVPYFREVSFTAGLGSGAGNTLPPADGEVITRGANTATIKRVVTQSGSWAAGTAAGRFVITTPAPGEFAGGAGTVPSGAGFTISGASTLIAMLPGGTFEFDIGNFSGQAATIRAYGCDGINRGFEFDGVTLVPITTGTAPDIPKHVKIFKTQLFFAFGSSVIHSGPGTPFVWTAIGLSSEIACSDIVTNFLSQPGTTTTAALGITTRTNTFILYGTGSTSWNLTAFNTQVGGIPFTGQLLNQSYWMESSGVINLQTALNYGNFKQATITNQIVDYIASQRSKVAYSVLNRTKNQYRILFTDNSALVLTIVNGKLAGITKNLYSSPMFCAWSSFKSTLDERVFCGAGDSGYVYQMDKGSSFDGGNIEAFLVFNYNAMKTPRVKKHFLRASVEVQGTFYANFLFRYAIGYTNPKILQPVGTSYDTGLTFLPYWDTFIWDAFTWDGVTLNPTNVKLNGRAENIQSVITTTTNYIMPFTINSIIYHYTLGRGLR